MEFMALGQFGDKGYMTQYIVSYIILNTIYCGYGALHQP